MNKTGEKGIEECQYFGGMTYHRCKLCGQDEANKRSIDSTFFL